MSISQPPFQSTLVDANDRVQTPWAQWFSQLQPILQSVVASGPTSGRPTQNLYIGYPYFDTTIDQMIYWNGVIWVTYAPSTTGTSILKGNGSGGFNNAVAGVDFAPATSGIAILYGDGAGGFSSVSIGSGVTFAGGVLSATGSGGTVTSVTGTAPIASSGGNTPAISISQAGVSTNGYLSSTDWNTFNNKGSGTVTAVTGSGNIASSGGTTPDITFTGTLPIANGGTNGTATPTAGAVAVGNGTQYAFTAAGSAGQVLTSNGSTVPTWATVATGIGTTGYWGSFWDTTNQTAASTTVAYIITLNNTDANSNGVSIVSSSRITFAYAGAYNLQFSAQFVNTDTQIHNAQVWLRLNGTDVTDSMGTVAIQQKHGGIDGVNIVSWNYVLKLSAGDYLQLVWNVDSTQVSLQTLPAGTSPTHPESPSVIVTATPVTEVGIGYYNLTSVSSVAIATGSKTFTTNLSNISTAFTVGTRVRVAYVTTPANYMEGVITSFSGTTLVVNVDSIGGSGTYNNWTISVAGIQGSNGVTSITGTANQVIASASTGAVTLSLPQSINSGAAPTFTGTNFTGIPNAGLTNSSITINGSSVSLGGSATVTATTTNALTIGTGLSGTSYNGSTAVTIANTGVLSFSGNTTGLTPATATTGAITLAGILVGANGGTGVANTGKTFTIGGNFTTSGAFTTTLTVTANTSLTLPISGTVLSSVTAPTANPVTGTPSASTYLRGDGTWATFTTGTVTSVAATVPTFLSVSGSPITTSGTLAITLSGTALPVTNGGTGLTTLTAGYIPYGNGTSALNSSSSFLYDGTHLGLGVTTPIATLDMVTPFWVRGANAAGAAVIISADSTTGTNGISIAASFITGGYGPIKFSTSAVERVQIDASGNTYIELGNLWQYAPAPTSIAAATTLTAAQLRTDIINTTGTTYTVTLPTGTAIDTAFAGVPTTNIGFDFHIVNSASGIITIAVGATGMTSVGTLTVPIAASACFRLRRSAAATYILYRLS